MSLETVRAQLVEALAEVDRLLLPPVPPSLWVVGPGENLWSLIESRRDIETFVLSDGYALDYAGEVSPTRPVTIQAMTPGVPRPRLAMTSLLPAPGTTLVGVALYGLNPHGAVVRATDGLTALDCWVRGPARRGLEVNCADVTIDRCDVNDIYHTEDAQAIAGWSGTRNLRVRRSTLAASGEVIMFGGADPASADLIPTDIEIEDCDLTKPLAWRGVPGRTAKNLFELKNAIGVRMRRCRLSHSWAGGQTGYAIVLTVRNQDGRAPWSTIRNVELEDIEVDGCGSGVQILGRDDTRVSNVMEDVTLRRVTFRDVNPRAWGGGGRQVAISGGPRRLTLEGLSFAGSDLNSFLSFDQPQHVLEGFIVRGGSYVEGEYGIFGTGAPGLGIRCLDVYAPGYLFEGVTVTGASASGRWINYPAGTIRA